MQFYKNLYLTYHYRLNDSELNENPRISMNFSLVVMVSILIQYKIICEAKH